MSLFKMAAATVLSSLLAALGTFALTTTLHPAVQRNSRLLLIGGTDENWQRSIAGARAAAEDLGLQVEIRTPSQMSEDNQQSCASKQTEPSDYAGVLFSPAAHSPQLNLINRLANQTRLVTIDHDPEESRRLCHIDFCQTGAGGLVAELVSDQLKRPGKVALIASTFSDVPENANVIDRLTGFKAMWATLGVNRSSSCILVEADTSQPTTEQHRETLAATLADPEVQFIVAFDAQAAEAALKALAAGSQSRHIPIVAFDPNRAIFDAIEDGRIVSAIFNDPYRTGFAAVQRLGELRDADECSLPVPGYGKYLLKSEVISRENLADLYRRIRS